MPTPLLLHLSGPTMPATPGCLRVRGPRRARQPAGQQVHGRLSCFPGGPASPIQYESGEPMPAEALYPTTTIAWLMPEVALQDEAWYTPEV